MYMSFIITSKINSFYRYFLRLLKSIISAILLVNNSLGTDKNIKINFSDTHALKSWAEYFLFGVEVSRVYICILILSLDNTSRPCISRGQHWLLSLIWKRLLWKWIFFIDVDIVALVWVTIYGICNIFFWKKGRKIFVAGDEFICQVEYSWNK